MITALFKLRLDTEPQYCNVTNEKVKNCQDLNLAINPYYPVICIQCYTGIKACTFFIKYTCPCHYFLSAQSDTIKNELFLFLTQIQSL